MPSKDRAPTVLAARIDVEISFDCVFTATFKELDVLLIFRTSKYWYIRLPWIDCCPLSVKITPRHLGHQPTWSLQWIVFNKIPMRPNEKLFRMKIFASLVFNNLDS